MEFSVFYAWQNDTPVQGNRYFIRDVIERAVKRIVEDPEVTDSPRLDHDTKGVSGMPEIAATIFEKIRGCGVFIGDLTLVGTTDSPSGGSSPAKRLPNPNVLLELGYAAGKIGWERIVCVMNEHYGKANEQIFDIRHRRFPICYTLSPDGPKDKAEVRASLVTAVEAAIRAVMLRDHEAVEDVISSLDVNCLRVMKDFGPQEYFSSPNPNTHGEMLAFQPFENAIIRLLVLKVLECRVNPAGGLYAYHWTYLGKLVLAKLGMRSPLVT